MTERREVRAAGAVIPDGSGRILMVRRAREPGLGTWSVPGGRVESGETLEAAAAREVLEETGLTVAIGRCLWTVPVEGEAGVVYEIHDFLGQVVSGELAAGDDAAEVRWFTMAEMERVAPTDDLLGHIRRAGLG